MPTLDAYEQGIEIAALTDAPNAEELSRDIVNALTPRSVMRFQSASERNATLASPTPGMVCYLITEDLFTGYTAGGWAVLAAGSQVWSDLQLAAEFSHNGNNNGQAQWRMVNLFGERTIMLRGAVGVDYSGGVAGNYLMNSTPLPPEARPTTLRTIGVPCSDVGSTRIALKLDLRTDGYLQLFGTGSNDQPIWVGLNGTFCSL